MRSLGKHLHNAWQIVKVAALIALIASAITLIYLVARGWLSFGPYSIILGILGMIIIVVGGCMLVARTETNSWNEGQLAIQKYAMINAPRADSGAARGPTWTTGPVLEPNPIDWNVRKTDDGAGYAVVPLWDGQPQWQQALFDDQGHILLLTPQTTAPELLGMSH